MSMTNGKIVCLCGSTKFKTEFEKAMLDESLKGHIVLSVICFSHADRIVLTEEEKQLANDIHLSKMDMADEILVINPNGYMGIDTRREIEYAIATSKPVRYLEPID